MLSGLGSMPPEASRLALPGPTDMLPTIMVAAADQQVMFVGCPNRRTGCVTSITIPRRDQVEGPATPSWTRRSRAWKATNAVRVLGPKTPSSARRGAAPFLFRRRCRSLTGTARLPWCRISMIPPYRFGSPSYPSAGEHPELGQEDLRHRRQPEFVVP